MGSILERAIESIGPIAAAQLIRKSTGPHQDRLIDEFSRVAPSILVSTNAQILSQSLLEVTCKLVTMPYIERLRICDYDIRFIECLRKANFSGEVIITPPPSICPTDLRSMRKNVPDGLDLKIADPNTVPTDLYPGRDHIVALAFDAGCGTSLLRSTTVRALRMISALNFVGEIMALQPVDTATMEQPFGWEVVENASIFRQVIKRDGYHACLNI